MSYNNVGHVVIVKHTAGTSVLGLYRYVLAFRNEK